MKSQQFIIGFSLFAVMIVVEMIWSYRKQKKVYNAKETASNIFIITGMMMIRPINLAWKFAVLGWVSQFRLTTIPNNVWTVILAVVAVDFLYYWQHRLYHEIRLLWTLHNVHHSSPWMNFSTSFRLNWLGPLVAPIFLIPAVLVGFSLNSILVFFLLNLFYQFFLHTEAIGKIPYIEGWLNTPSAHRVHHGSNPKYIDKNYGGILMVWDRLFGTYQEEEEEVIYGVTTGFMGHNPLVVLFAPLVHYLRGEFVREKHNLPPQEGKPTQTLETKPTKKKRHTNTALAT